MIRHGQRHWTLIAAGACVFAALAAGSSAAPADVSWPQWRGPNRDALSADSHLLQEWPASGPPLAWAADGLGSGFSGVSIAAGRIFTMGDLDDAQYVIALKLDGGGFLWKARLGPTHVDSRGGPRATPTVDGERVYALGTEGDLVCLDATTGRERWRKNLVRDFGGQMMSRWKFSESPLVDGERVVVTPGASNAMLVALDKTTGAELWRSAVPDLGPNGKDGAGYSSAVITHGGGVRHYVQLTGRGLVGVRADDGRFLWGYNRVANKTANVSTPIVKGDLVFASTGYQTGSALLELKASGDGVEAREVYFLDGKTLQNHHGGLVLVDDHIYAGHGHNKGFPICVELRTGEVKWGGRIRNAGQGSAAVAYADGHLYFRYQDGRMLLIEATPEGYRGKGSFEIPAVDKPSWPHPVVVGGRLYLREQDRLYCYDLRRQ